MHEYFLRLLSYSTTIYVDAQDDVRNQLPVEYSKASVLAWVPE